MSKIKRQLTLRNTSSVPLTIIWCIFLMEEESDDFPTYEYFNVLFNIYDPGKCFEVVDGDLLITDEFYGWTDYKIFNV